MINKTLRRLAVGAAAITVAGVVVPLAAATSASAAEPTSLAANPTSQYVGVGNTGTAGTIPVGSPTLPYVVTLSPTTAAAANGVSYDVYSGPDASTTAPFTGTACTMNTATKYTCNVAYNDVEGTDAIHFYVPATAGGAYQAGDVTVNGTLIKGGPATSYTISPTSGNGSTDICVGYVVSGKDASGNPASGNVPATVKETLPTASTAPAALQFCNPTSTTFPAVAEASSTAGVPAVSGTNTTYSATEGTQSLGTGSDYSFPSAGGTGVTPGSVKIGVSSDAAGTLNISAGRSVAATTTSPAVTPATATAAISKGNTLAASSTANDNNAASLALSPGDTTAFPSGTVTEKVTVKNSAGDAIGGVTVVYEITSGPDKTSGGPQACAGGTTDGAGQTTCSYPAAAGASGKDTFVAYVNQSTSASPTSGPDSGEPQATATVTVNNPTVTGGTATNLKSNCDTAAKCTDTTTTTSVPVTFTLKDDSGNPIAGANIAYTDAKTGSVTIASASPATPLTTDANGQATVTLTVSGAANGDTVTVTGQTTQFTHTATDTATVTFATSGAAASVSLSPVTQVASSGAKVTETATVLDGFQKPVSGATVTFSVIGRNNPGNNTGATGSCTTTSSGSCSFTYTDVGTPVTNTFDTVTASTTGASNATATVYYYTDTAANTVTTTYTGAGTSPGTCPGSNPAGPFATEGPNGKFQTVCVQVQNAASTNLNGTPVTLTISSGSFASSTGASQSGTSETANVGAQGQANYAVFYVRSATSGTQTLTATSGSKSSTVKITYVNQQFNPVTPVRLVDTRIGQGGVSNGPLAPDTAYTFSLDSTIAPQGAAAYVFNVTAIDPSGQGNLRIGPSQATLACAVGIPAPPQVPQTSLINYESGTDVANDVIVPNTSGCDDFTLYSAGSSANVAIDLQGYYSGGYSNVTPTRYVDTRPGSTNQGGTTGPIPANSSASFTLAGGAANIPATATAVAINVTAIGPTGQGNLRVYPDGTTAPNASNINYIPGIDKAAFAVIQLPKNGKIDVYSAGSPVNVAIDVFGYFPSTSNVVTQTPARVFDSRSGTGLRAGVPVNVPVTAPTASNGVPASATAVLVSVTAIHAADSTGVGNLRVYPTGVSTPTVSNINYVSTSSDVANFAIVPIGANGQITLYSAGSNINAAVDILGYVPAGS